MARILYLLGDGPARAQGVGSRRRDRGRYPHDFDRPETAANVEWVLRKLLRERMVGLPESLDWEGMAVGKG